MITYYDIKGNPLHKGMVDIFYYDECFKMIGQEVCVPRPEFKKSISVKKINHLSNMDLKYDLATKGSVYCGSSQSANAIAKWGREHLKTGIAISKQFNMWLVQTCYIEDCKKNEAEQ